ncbi:ABC transporter substrate-binding protein [Enterocloster bolteae]|jgi:peptide/nickel transport system substrate-binding protein|uniref:ABC transporter substrate-binding protein n=2 Tax=Clostridia TaxID=186801 RepID=UPI0018A04016|nr:MULTISPECIES: ABC transporter substrate-binding protein [Clostridia]MCB7091947.1 ABC transporter substrate-binding protein [Enterocloster bolteae]MCH1938122.1 ABC transporter substrate-binding protein [Enterocloster sp. OA11]
MEREMRRGMKYAVAAMLAVSMAVTGCANSGAKDSTGQSAENSGGNDARETGDNGTREDVIVVMGPTSEPEAGFDPAYGWGAGEHVHEPLIQSTLTVTTADLKIGYDLATDMEVSQDGLTWTVKIRDDAYFTDGEKLTARDVAFTYNTLRDTSSVNDFTMLESAEAPDGTTAVFHMNRPYSIWPYTMAIVGIVPEHAYGADYGSHPIGSGRYIMKQWDKGQQVIFEANPDYYGPAPNMKKVTILFMEEDAAYAAVMSGQADLAYTAASYSDQTLPGYELLSFETVDNRGFNLPAVKAGTISGGNTGVGNDFTSDVQVRRAVNIAINRDEMIEHVLNGYGSPAYSVCDKMPWYNESAKTEYNPEKAAELLEEAGWKAGSDGIREKNGVKAGFTLMYPASDSVRQALAADTANQLRNVGIDVKIEGVGWDDAYDRAQTEPLMWGWGAHTPMELYNIYHTMKDTGLAEYSPYANDSVDRYMDQALASGNLEDSYELWKKAQWDGTTGVTQNGDIPWIWLVNIDHLYWSRDGLKVAEQKIHPHGHGWSIVNNVDQWSWE